MIDADGMVGDDFQAIVERGDDLGAENLAVAGNHGVDFPAHGNDIVGGRESILGIQNNIVIAQGALFAIVGKLASQPDAGFTGC